MEYGVQLYSVRDITQNDMRGALSALAKQGYSFVEFAGFFGHSAKDIRAMLDENHLTVSGTHTSLKELQENFDETVAYHKEIGNTRIIVPYAQLVTQLKLFAFIDAMNEMQAKLLKEGIRLGYHNHADEFSENTDGTFAFDQLVAHTSLDLEIDTYWVYAAKLDPVAIMEEVKARMPVIHIKDGYINGKGMPLGRGTAPVAAVYQKAVSLGIPMVVESETLTPDGLTETNICIKYLRSLEK